MAPPSEQRLATTAWWGLLGALFGGGAMFAAWAAWHWDLVGVAWAGLAGSIIGAGLAMQAARIASRAAVVEPGAGRFRTNRAKRQAVREYAPMAGAANFIAAIALAANVLVLFGFLNSS